MNFLVEKLLPVLAAAVAAALVVYVFTYRGQRENRLVDAYAEVLADLAELLDVFKAMAKTNRTLSLPADQLADVRRLGSRVAATVAKAAF